PKQEIKEEPKQEIKEEPKQEIKEEPKQEDPAAAFARAKAAFREQAIDLYARQAHEFKIEQHIKAHTEYTPEEIQSVRDGNRYESIRDSEENKAFKAQIADSPLFGDFLASITDMGKLDAAKDLAADNNGKALYDFINQEKFRAAAAAPEVREAPKQEDAPKNNADDQKIQKIVSAKKNTSEKRWRPLVRMFGKNGHMVAGNSVYKPECIQEYDSIELPIPDGLTEDMVALIAMGVAMDRSKLNKKMTDSTPAHGVSLVEWNAGFIAMNLLTGDSRSIGFSEHLVESRKIAKQILEDYQNNKPEGIKAVQKAIQNVVPTALADFTHMDLHSLGQVEHELPVILEKMSKVPKLGLSTPKNIQPKLTSHRVRVEASDQAIAAFEELAKTKPAANTPERERLVAEFLFEHAVAAEGMNSRPDALKMIKEKHENQVIEEYREYANIPEPKKELWDKRGAEISSALVRQILKIDDDGSINDYVTNINMELLVNANYAYQKAHLTPGELTLTEPGGKEKLRAFYMEDIKRSDIFKAMVSEPDM
ncbi:MAG: hypothetical protein IJV04_08575, partial [Lachnospiraceae bacterium]|nr:hypothetical protein [Lachnospiraceae bacterium]